MTRNHAIRSAAILLALAAGCGKPAAPAAPATDVRAAHAATLPTNADDGAWGAAAEMKAPLVLQDMVDPRKMEVGIAEVRVKALTDGKRIAFRMEWDDPTADDLRVPARFSDACAVQLPATASPDSPAPQMGEPGRPVTITFWTASTQAILDGRPLDLKTLYPNSKIDHYPAEAAALDKDPAGREQMEKMYSPAHALGNTESTKPAKAVQDLVSEGPGTLKPAAATESEGRGRRTPKGWQVVITRALPAGLAPGARSLVAFAVWNGASDDTGARKMRTIWIPLAMPGGAAK
ncbi:MAG: hypothetical protein HYY18_09220 [Planctomycetes bacterium]|nr:hypothetical protein [Planctomycetota bacterium]